MISGAFSVTRQAVQLGFWPRMQILHTSAVEGQIYLPQVNALLLCAVLVLVLLFRNSENLAAAYGFAVTGTMLTTSVLAFAVLPRGSTGGKRVLWMVLLGALLVIDILLFGANIFKIHEGGWLPLLVGVVVFTLMMTWRRGRRLLADMQARDRQPLRGVHDAARGVPPARVQGTAIFMTMNAGNVPPALLRQPSSTTRCCTISMTCSCRSGWPTCPMSGRQALRDAQRSAGVELASQHQLRLQREDPDVPDALRQVAEAYPEIDLEPDADVVLPVAPDRGGGAAAGLWRAGASALFAFMVRNATRSTRFQDSAQPRGGNGHAGGTVGACPRTGSDTCGSVCLSPPGQAYPSALPPTSCRP